MPKKLYRRIVLIGTVFCVVLWAIGLLRGFPLNMEALECLALMLFFVVLAELPTFLFVKKLDQIEAAAVHRGHVPAPHARLPVGSARSCDQCGTALPRFRLARNFRQFLWGGLTCPGCAAELDLNGTAIARQEALDSPQ